jgi:GH25 family lysozyme M1 (1,4-beta-N-acetylmuramidase)
MVAEPSGPKQAFIDTSQYRGHIDAEAVAASGKVGLFPRTTFVESGTVRIDPLWKETCQRAIKAGLVTSARHRLFAHPSTRTQFDAFVRAAEDADPGCESLIITLDSENDASWAQVTEFEELCRDRWGVWPVMYYPCWWLNGLPGNPQLRDEAVFWHSRYASNPGDLCGGLTSLAGQMWQYTQSGTCPGVSPPVDLNWFYGTRAELEELTVDP